MELKYFRLIKTIVEEGNIANSSERLFLTQSALSHQLKSLEARLGFKVFVRSRNKWNLTQEGEELYSLANDILGAMDRGFNKIKRIKEGTKGLIRVSSECQSFFLGLPAFIQKMAILYPEIQIDLILTASNQSISNVLSDMADLALVTRNPESALLDSIEVFEDEIFAVIHKEHYLSEVDYLEASHFAGIHLLINSFPLESVSVYQHFLKPNNIEPLRISAIPFTEVSLDMVASNMGIICLPKWQVNNFKLSDQLMFKRIGKHGVKRTHYLLVKKADRNKKYIHDFISNFEEDFLRK